uniref:DAGKc domain-containing protein n=1 Tax=Geoglobus ahangari TaxID=113653 RepID=A0A7C3YES0_9EURY
MKVGVVVNPKAGGGVNKELILKVLRKLNPEKVITGQDDLGASYLKGAEIVEIERSYDRNDTIRLVRELDKVADVIVIFGGDGTMSDAASAFPEKPLLCIGTGTTNVSPLLCDPEFRNLKLVEFDCLFVKKYNRIAFNDVVAGPTILSTVNGKVTEIDALEFMRGKIRKGKRGKFFARVEAEGRVIEGNFGNVFISMLDRRYLGKGISGGASISAFVGFKCLVACISETIVVSSLTKEELMNLEPIRTETLSFDKKAKLFAETIISADGNPFTFNDEVEVEFKEKIVKVLKNY